MDAEQPPHDKVADMAADYTTAIRAAQPHGPYALCGYSFGGLVALEIVQRMGACETSVPPLVRQKELGHRLRRARTVGVGVRAGAVAA
jgi:thioesterase domain-containing protein